MFLKNNHAASREASAPNAQPSTRKIAPTIIASDVSVLGNLASEGVLDMDGKVDGTVKAAQVTIRSNGSVKGDVIGETVHVYGEVKGVIRAKTVVLYSSCRVEGIIMHESLTIEDGAFVDGKFKRTDKTSAANDDELYDSYEESMALGNETEMRTLKMLENLKLVTG